MKRILSALVAVLILAGCGGGHQATAHKLHAGPSVCPGYVTPYGCSAHSPTFGLPPVGPPKLTAPTAVPTVSMFDSVTVSVLPHDARAYAGYLNGNFRTFLGIVAGFPGAVHVPITVQAFPVYPTTARMACLDVEPLDATPDQAGPWARGEIRLGVKPCLYSALKNGMSQVQQSLARWLGSGWRSKVFLWDADWTGVARLDAGFDATQYTDHWENRNVDGNVATRAFLGLKPPAPPLPICFTHRISRSACSAAKAKVASDQRAAASSQRAYVAKGCAVLAQRDRYFSTQLRKHPRVKTASRHRALAATRLAEVERGCQMFAARARFFTAAAKAVEAAS